MNPLRSARVLAVALLAAASTLAPAAPAAAVPGRVVVSGTTLADLAAKTAEAVCPAGTLLLGGGGRVTGGNGVAQLNHTGPRADGRAWQATAYPHEGYRDGVFVPVTPFAVQAWAVCGTGVTGHTIVRTSYESLPGQTTGTAKAYCPKGRKAIGLGGSVHKSRFILDDLVVDAALGMVTVQWNRAREVVPGDYAGLVGWGDVWAICVDPVPGQQRAYAASPLDTADKSVVVTCPAGTTVHGIGGALGYADNGAKFEAMAPWTGSGTAQAAARPMVYGTTTPWQVSAMAICAA
ncbi:hypothetical protein ACFQY4_15860 [Catellatospora bangladeshensis]|uniref:Uncharacterized protein n=1 Tax=Catellatospora bangladeshensis TaxID=310355 RepID=A0A8J3NMQ8_9ACTN|nr:hypothetical protein [Catellatospora bangladeshensis]GIF86427.1 hypothetical protein Cba03nite_77760 [Catellatospora bangladeshensis]